MDINSWEKTWYNQCRRNGQTVTKRRCVSPRASFAADSSHPLRLTTNKNPLPSLLKSFSLISMLVSSKCTLMLRFWSSRCESIDATSCYNGQKKRRSSIWERNGCNRLLIILADTYYITYFRLPRIVGLFLFRFVQRFLLNVSFPRLFFFVPFCCWNSRLYLWQW